MPDFLQRHFNALGLHYQRQIAFVRARLAPQIYLGLRLKLGAMSLICSTWLFGSIAEDVVSGDALTMADAWLELTGSCRIVQAQRSVDSC